MIDFSIFFRKRVLVTGHTGFKGSWLVSVLERAGAQVHGLALEAVPGSLHEQLGRANNSEQYVDVTNYNAVQSVLMEFRPEVIFHLAAQSLVLESYANPRNTFETNIMGGVNILDAVYKTDSVRALVFVTSDKAYENHEWEWGYRENDTLGGSDPYSASKGAVELVVKAYSKSFTSTAKIATARAGNVIGGGDWSENRIVPDIIKATRSGNPIVLRNPLATRPWQHVLEPLSGYLLLAQRMLEGDAKVSDTYNFGPETSGNRTVMDLATSLSKKLDGGAIQIEAVDGMVAEAGLLGLNCDRAKKHLGWMPRWDFEQTVEKTGEWYLGQSKGKTAASLTHNQISEYFYELR